MNTHTNYNNKDYNLDELYLCNNFSRRLVGRDDPLESYNDLKGYVKLLTNDKYFSKHKIDYYLKMRMMAVFVFVDVINAIHYLMCFIYLQK